MAHSFRLASESPDRLAPPLPQPTRPGAAGTTRCRLIGEMADGWAIAMLDLSPQGIHLSVSFFLPVGKELTVEIHNPACDYSCRRQVRLVYALEEPDGLFQIWGTFLQPLGDTDVHRLLDP